MAKRYYYCWLRYPKTAQELRNNQERNGEFTRSKRRNLPTSYDDLIIHYQKGWKYWRRKNQYRVDSNYSWHQFYYNWWDKTSGNIYLNLLSAIEKNHVFMRNIKGGIEWFGPNFLNE